MSSDRRRSLIAGLLALALGACSSGSFDSQVGERADPAPTARPEVLNGGTTKVFREGSEVLLTGKASEDGDGPVLRWRWRQTGGPAVTLIEVNAPTRSFTAPQVDAPSELQFELTVEDSSGQIDTAATVVTVTPARDSDKFLSLDISSGLTFDGFRVAAALAGGASAGPFALPFQLSARSYLVYPPRSSQAADCAFVAADFAAGIPQSTASGCRVEPLADLLPNGETVLADEWPADVEAPEEDALSMLERWWNPRYVLAIPRLDVREFNQRFVDSGSRDQLLDSFVAHRAQIVIDLQLTAPLNQQDASLIVTDLTGAPVPMPIWLDAAGTHSEVIDNPSSGQPTRVIVPLDTLLAAILGKESALTSEVYYRTVDPLGTRKTLNQWLEQAGFAEAGDGVLRPDAIAGSGQFAHAVYMNNFDLGFGRQMYARTDEHGNVFSFVQNHRTLESAIRELDSFVTVVMEYSPLRNHADPTEKLVKFFSYIDDGTGDERRIASFDFDGRGERFTPGNCTTCHGGAKPPSAAELVYDESCGDRREPSCYTWPAVNRDGDEIADGNLEAMFLPWDLESLLYADTDPAITAAPIPFDGISLAAELGRDYGDFSRQRQEAQFKRLNQAVYDTYADVERTAEARRLLEHWYGGTDQNGQLLGTFDGSEAIAGWRDGELVPDPEAPGTMIANPADASVVYQVVYARHCRSCHTNQFNRDLRFTTYREFMLEEAAITQSVFGAGTMPGARLTMDRLWAPFDTGTAPGVMLGEHIGRELGEPARTAPGAAGPVILGLEPGSQRGDTVYLSGEASALAESFEWGLRAPAGSAAALVGARSKNPLFQVDLPGTYEVSLTLNSGTSAEATTTAAMQVDNRSPVATNDLMAMTIQDTALSGSVLAGLIPDSDPDGDSLTAFLASGGAPAHGQVVVGADGRFTYTYTGDTVDPPSTDSFDYVVRDGFGGEAGATVTILLNAAPAAERPTTPVDLGVTDASTAGGDASDFRAVLSWKAAADDVQVLGYNIYRDGTLLATILESAPPGSAVTYVDTAVVPDTRYSYRVTAVDAGSESELSAAADVTIVPSLRRNIQAGWGTGNSSLWQVSGCVGCHRGSQGGLTLRGPGADDVYGELTEDAGVAAPRLNLAAVSRSLLLCKPLLATHPRSCAHGGGNFLVASDAAFQTLLRWIERGAPNN